MNTINSSTNGRGKDQSTERLKRLSCGRAEQFKSLYWAIQILILDTFWALFWPIHPMWHLIFLITVFVRLPGFDQWNEFARKYLSKPYLALKRNFLFSNALKSEFKKGKNSLFISSIIQPFNYEPCSHTRLYKTSCHFLPITKASNYELVNWVLTNSVLADLVFL